MAVRVVDGCIKCGACVRVCPILRDEGESVFPGPRRLVVEAPRFPNGLAVVQDPLTLCTTCGLCQEVCPSQLPLPQALVRVRSMLPGPRSEGRSRMQENFDRTGHVVSTESVEEWPSEGDLAFFPGCISNARLASTVRASLDLLRASGARPYIPKGWGCCGSPLEKIGDLERSRRAISANIVALDGIDTIVASCPGCTAQLQTAYGKNAIHIIEYLHSQGSLTPSSFRRIERPLRIALHAPCHLSRVVGPHTMDMARELLSLVPGVMVIEQSGDGCCGGGGGVASSHPGAAMRMAARRLISARQAGADLLVAPCPFCVTNLRRVGSLEVEELMVFLAGRLSNHNLK